MQGGAGGGLSSVSGYFVQNSYTLEKVAALQLVAVLVTYVPVAATPFLPAVAATTARLAAHAATVHPAVGVAIHTTHLGVAAALNHAHARGALAPVLDPPQQGAAGAVVREVLDGALAGVVGVVADNTKIGAVTTALEALASHLKDVGADAFGSDVDVVRVCTCVYRILSREAPCIVAALKYHLDDDAGDDGDDDLDDADAASEAVRCHRCTAARDRMSVRFRVG